MKTVWEKEYSSEGKNWKVGFKMDEYGGYFPYTTEDGVEKNIPLFLDGEDFKEAIIKITDCPFKDMKGNFEYFTMIVAGACRVAMRAAHRK